MPLVTVRYCKRVESDITLYYDTFGDSTNPPLLLICGMGMLINFWSEDFCEKLASSEYGFYVIRIENRDVGMSTHLDHLGEQSVCKLACCPCLVTPSYTLPDMAADIIAFMDKLEFTEGVHLCGQSMGGMIVQYLVDMCEPGRIKSAAFIYSSPGEVKNKNLSSPSLKVKLALALRPKEETPESFADNWLEKGRIAFFKKDVLERNYEWARNMALTAFRRSMYLAMDSRQASMVVKPEDRTEMLKRIKIPCVVIHGDVDVLVGPDHGRALAGLIPNSKFVLVKDMGHRVAPDFFEEVCDAIAENAGVSSSTSATKPNTDKIKIEENLTTDSKNNSSTDSSSTAGEASAPFA